MLIVYIVIFATCTTTQIIHGANIRSYDSYVRYGGRALHALQRLLNFFESDANHLNLDGLYGLRIAQGQLDALHQTVTSSDNKQTSVTDKNNFIESLSKQIERIANVSLNAIAYQTSSYLHRFSLIVHHPFVIQYRTKRIDRHLIEKGARDPDFDEEESDKCFAELLGKDWTNYE